MTPGPGFQSSLDKAKSMGKMQPYACNIGLKQVQRAVLKKPKSFFLSLLFLFAFVRAGAQDMLTAENYFDQVSDRYGKIQDYEAQIRMSKGDTVMSGVLYYKNPNLLRINFTEPEEQVLATDGELLSIYIPKYEVILEQKLKRRSQAAVAQMASQQGLHLLKKNYGVAYLISPDEVPLDEDSDEMVVKLKLELTWIR